MIIKENVELKHYTSYHIGGLAKYLLEPQNLEELRQALEFQKEKVLPLLILGGGNNILFSDGGFDGVIIKPEITFIRDDGDDTIEIGSGTSVEEIIDYSIERGLSGLEWAGGLPGTLGGAIFGNAGAFKGEVKDSIIEVSSLNINNPDELITRKKEECGFEYRSSIFKRDKNEIIISAKLKFTKANSESIKSAVEEKINYRKERQPLDYPSAGSVFKNVDLSLIKDEFKDLVKDVIKIDPSPVVPVAFLLSEAGLKGKVVGGAMISEKHPNFIVNFDNASAKDVLGLIELARREVFDKFKVDLETEIQIVN